ncbi:hypothetical protein ACLOJK_034402 [Asimina triloba]
MVNRRSTGLCAPSSSSKEESWLPATHIHPLHQRQQWRIDPAMVDDSDPISMTDQREENGEIDKQRVMTSSTTIRWRVFSSQKISDDISIKNPSLPHKICKPSHSKVIDPSPIGVFLKTGHGCRLYQSPSTAFFFKSSSPIMAELIFSLPLQI